MRSFHRNLCFIAALALVGAACGGDNGPSNSAPTANFAAPTCTMLNCTFTDASTDSDGSIASRSWAFENGTPAASTAATQAVTFAGPGTHTVMLTVTDNEGATDDFSLEVTVSTTPNTPPTADFDFICNALECTFTDASTDADGTVASWSWDFDDGSAADVTENPVHTYPDAPLTTYNVTLTVTDDDGATNAVTKDVAVAPPAETVCDNGSGTFVECGLVLTNAATVRVTITSLDCTADGNTLTITAPDPDETVFTDGCSQTAGDFFDLNNGAAYAAGTELRAQMVSGSDDPDRIAPQLRVTGTYPNWLLEFDDGEDPTGPGEPDFNDIVMTVVATE